MTARTSGFLALLTKKDDQARLDELCEFAPVAGSQEERVYWLVRLVAWLRPKGGVAVRTRLRFLRGQLEQHPEWKANVAGALGELLRATELEELFAYGGIPKQFHFAGAVQEWLSARLLPSACRTSDGGEILHLAFEVRDLEWVGSPELVTLLRDLLDASLVERLEKALADALIDVAHQIVAQAHAPYIRTLAQAERSPFRGLYDAVVAVEARPTSDAGIDALRGRIKQCLLLLRGHRSELVARGADLNTTFQIDRMRQQLDRLGLLANLRHEPSDPVIGTALFALVGSVARAWDGRRLLARSADLVVQNLVDSAATVGRKYLGEEQSSWRAALRAGAGGGVLMAIATVVKFLVSSLHLTPLYEGLAFSLNYGAAFCAAYLLHFTIATKLPAHTAAALARAVQATGGHRARLAGFVAVWRSMLRLQLAGIVGNVIVTAPLAYGIDKAVFYGLGHHLISADKAHHVLTAQSLLGPSVLFAALTGLFLWISSLVGAAGDNWTRVTHLTERLVTNVRVMKRIPTERAGVYAEAIVSRSGGLLGNLCLGFLLGAVPAAFAIASIPVEIRHVTVSTGSVAVALATGAGSRVEIALAIGGVVAIAVANMGVSFVLALWLALRATRGMRTSTSSSALVRIGIRNSFRRGRQSSPRLTEEGVGAIVPLAAEQPD